MFFYFEIFQTIEKTGHIIDFNEKLNERSNWM